MNGTPKCIWCYVTDVPKINEAKVLACIVFQYLIVRTNNYICNYEVLDLTFGTSHISDIMLINISIFQAFEFSTCRSYLYNMLDLFLKHKSRLFELIKNEMKYPTDANIFLSMATLTLYILYDLALK